MNAFGIGGLNVHVVVDEYDPHWETQITPGAPQEEPIAIIGRGVILPGALNVSALQQLLRSGDCKLMDAPTTRWRKRIGIQPNVAVPHAAPHARGGFIEGYEYDWRKYKIPPKQVSQANPLQFMLLDASRQALEEAGYHQTSL